MSFFDNNYTTPNWLKAKLSRRHMLKSAAGMGAITALPCGVMASNKPALTTLLQTEPWLTLDAVLNHLLPSSDSGPGAKELQATNYLHQVITEQPIEQAEKDFILKGVGWLNSYSNSQLQQPFSDLNFQQKEQMLRAISGSQAGKNWLNTLINYLYEAMLSPPVYGGNPNGIGWQWLKHQAGFPLPKEGTRFYEIPSRYQIKVKNLSTSHVPVTTIRKSN